MILFFFTLSFLFSEHGFDEVAIPNPSAKLKMINHPLYLQYIEYIIRAYEGKILRTMN